MLASNLVTPQNYALVISGQFSGFAYNETASEVGPVVDVWDNFVASLHGSTAGAVLLVLFLVACGIGLIGVCFRPPPQLAARMAAMGGGGGGGGGRQGAMGGMVSLQNEGGSSPPGPPPRVGEEDGRSPLAHVVPPAKPARRQDDFGGLL